ncbi:bifunctional hydroxymethylpyrimidine kinase/phosphomethylpyrimidine kinase [[Limnothrix rosea] IAM M-220]|uniref:bifunctional hydroxymethylpyrimidine kinase/phosphomethylpyrimidine kinase n=1 Tax=[Limnothrix rosea] IAM M-220 TaxID=454133 RepID=UPI0009652A55|nr:bifunctional hydroxymethylpyrimidine kinase/phosphomethylpyrimidine kinase [[Limnothrix rosea] IAM M-220]OKH12947.1 bifunctional hydroxymethylpyrimidine kinase/phosphomethylpyrimidine kinase [[Limnothrix rosea] IAM M-220]
MSLNPRIALTIAGSDSGGGAGIQADLKTFAFNKVHGTSAITCVTAQNTVGVTDVVALSAAQVNAQIEAVLSDIGVHAVKTGMLLNQEIMVAIAAQAEADKFPNLVIDPVMVSRTGVKLIADEAITVLQERLVPQAKILTPNRYEAQILSAMEIDTLDAMKDAATKILDLGCQAVLVKGGAMPGELQGVDVWFDGDRLEVLRTKTIDTPHTHGTGCTLSAAITANLALGKEPFEAVQAAKKYVTEALQFSLAIGKGTGPVGHFYPLMVRDSLSTFP